MRHAFKAELYALSAAQRTNGATAVNQALDTERVQDITNRLVDPARVKRGQAQLIVKADFSADAAGQRVFNAARTWASTRAGAAANGEKSFVRVRSVDLEAGVITMRYAESPGWAAAVTTEPL